MPQGWRDNKQSKYKHTNPPQTRSNSKTNNNFSKANHQTNPQNPTTRKSNGVTTETNKYTETTQMVRKPQKTSNQSKHKTVPKEQTI
jgi:hypothetical protein